MSTKNMAKTEPFLGSTELPLTRLTPVLQSAKLLPIVGNIAGSRQGREVGPTDWVQSSLLPGMLGWTARMVNKVACVY